MTMPGANTNDPSSCGMKSAKIIDKGLVENVNQALLDKLIVVTVETDTNGNP
jgi:hypothetical protein